MQPLIFQISSNHIVFQADLLNDFSHKNIFLYEDITLMKLQTKVFLLIVLSTLCTIIICRQSIFVALIIDFFVFCMFVLLKSVAEALSNNQAEVSDEIKIYSRKISQLREKLKMGSLNSLRTNTSTSSVINSKIE